MKNISVPGKVLFLLIGLAVLLAGNLQGEEPRPDEDLAACDQLYAEGDLKGSEAAARAILARDPESYPASWKLSRALISAANLAADKEESRLLFLESRTYAELAVDLDPQGTRGFTCLAICAGSLSKFAGGRESITLAEEARDAAQKAIDLDGRNDLAYQVLGIWNREIATVSGFKKMAAKVIYGGVPSGASLENSESCLRRAVSLAPDRLTHHRQLGITLLAMGRLDEAIAELETATELPCVKPEDEIYAESAYDLLLAAKLERDESERKHW